MAAKNYFEPAIVTVGVTLLIFNAIFRMDGALAVIAFVSAILIIFSSAIRWRRKKTHSHDA